MPGERRNRRRVHAVFGDRIDLTRPEPLLRQLGALPRWRQATKSAKVVAAARLFRSLPATRIDALVELARERDATYSRPDELDAIVLEVERGANPQDLVDGIREHLELETVHVQVIPESTPIAREDQPGSSWRRFRDAVKPANEEPSTGELSYLDGEGGIDRRFAWGFPGGKGEGQHLVDVETGWTLEHEALAKFRAELFGNVVDAGRIHGTRVLGIVCGSSTQSTGIAPELESLSVAAHGPADLADVVLVAAERLLFGVNRSSGKPNHHPRYGGVLLIEAQAMKSRNVVLPIEVLTPEFCAIRLATALGLIVVEAAGNGGIDLDTYRDWRRRRILDPSPGNEDFRDSGAIVVSAVGGVGRNYGRRVDCCAKGENLFTADTTSTPPFASDRYTNLFDGTSGAAAIVAGAVLSLQGIAHARFERRLTPRLLRELLRDPANGIDHSPAGLGVLPSLRQLVRCDRIAIAPDVYLRDHAGDDGGPRTALHCLSPDIRSIDASAATDRPLSRGDRHPDPTARVAAPTIRVAIRNKGGSASSDARVHLYSAAPGPAVPPHLWNAMGVIEHQEDIPVGDTPVTAHVLDAANTTGLAEEPRSLIAVVEDRADPLRLPPAQLAWSDYRGLLRTDKIAFRNFAQMPIGERASAGDEDVVLSFVVAPPRDQAVRLELEVVARLPSDSRGWLALTRELSTKVEDRLAFEDADTMRVVRLNPHGRWTSGPIVLDANEPEPSNVQIRIRFPRASTRSEAVYRVWAGLIAIDQRSRQQLGRFTWELAPPRRMPR